MVVRNGDEPFRQAHPDWVPRVSPHPGMHISCLEWFREKDIAAISWDMMDERPTTYPGFAMSTHLAIPFLGLALVDNTNPERLAGRLRGGGTLRVPLHRHADPAGGLDRRSRAPDRDLLSAARATFAGLCATLVGIGLARFAYTPLLPALVGAGWFAPAGAAYLGAANLAGYLAGALLARALAVRTGPVFALRAMMALATAAFFACASPISFAWYFVWRLAAGIAGGVLMVLAAPTVLPHVPPARRGLAGGVIFTGVGLGIAASGTVVPLLLRSGLVQTWCGLGVIAAALTGIAWNGWPREQARGDARATPTTRAPMRAGLTPHGAVRRVRAERVRASCRTWSSWSTSSPVASAAGSTPAAATGWSSVSARCWGRCSPARWPTASDSDQPCDWPSPSRRS